MSVRSVPHLYAIAHGSDCAGPHRCCFCGAACDDSHPAADYLRDSFTGRDGLAAPGSPWACAGCVLCLRDAADITLVTGEVRSMARIAVRAWSWLVTAESARAASKAHLPALRDACLRGLPSAPWSIVLSDSGQKHLLYRGRVNQSASPSWVVTLEGEPVAYRPDDLAARLRLCGRLVAATGKPALAESVTTRFAVAVIERYLDGESLVAEWERVRCEPLSRLAGWLSPKKEDSQLEYPDERIPAGAAVA